MDNASTTQPVTKTGFINFNHLRSNKTRLAIVGLPNSGKTTCLSTFTDFPHVILVSPREKGVGSLPQGEGFTSHIFQVDPQDILSSKEIIYLFNQKLDEIISQVPATLTVEGCHKLYDYYLDTATEGAFLRGERFDSKLYGQAHTLFLDFLAKLFFCPIPLVIYTSWVELEYKEEQLSIQERRQARQQYYPKFPGQMAKAFLGEIDGTIVCDIRSDCDVAKCKATADGREHYVWQLNPYGDYRGCGFKLPPNHKPLPTFIHPRWTTLKRLLHERR